MSHQSFRGRLVQSDTWILEVFLGLYALVWGLGFANPLSDAFAANPLPYALLNWFPGGELWFGVAVSLLGALVLGSTLFGSRRLRSVAIGAAGTFWVAVSVAVGVPTQWANGGLPHFSLVVLAHVYLLSRLSYGGRTP